MLGAISQLSQYPGRIDFSVSGVISTDWTWRPGDILYPFSLGFRMSCRQMPYWKRFGLMWFQPTFTEMASFPIQNGDLSWFAHIGRPLKHEMHVVLKDL